MKSIMQKMMEAELSSASRKNYSVDLWVTFFGAAIFTVMSFTANDFGWGGFLAAVMFFWHRYVVLNLAKERSGQSAL